MTRLALTVLFLLFVQSTSPHDIYTGLRSKSGMLCCGGNDCSTTTYRERGGEFEFLTKEGEWVEIPQDRIQFLPIPGDPPSGESHLAHLYYRAANEFDKSGPTSVNVMGSIYLYCAFIPPGAI